ncbi:hypothetical protein HDU98_003087, partial [Podochytrium sp. JEL0797]
MAAPPTPRGGASAQYIHDQAVIVFWGGVTGPAGLETTLTAAQNPLVALNLRQAPFSAASWLSPPLPQIQNLQNYANPLFSSYAASVAARTADLGLQGNTDMFYYLFGKTDAAPQSPVFAYNPSSAATAQTLALNQATSSPPRVRTASCLLDPVTVLIHGGADGNDNLATTQTLASTYFLSLRNMTDPSQTAWRQKRASQSPDSVDPALHDHSMACVNGFAYMVGGINGLTSTTGETMDHVYYYAWSNDIVGGMWTSRAVKPDPASNLYPPMRKSATLTAVNPSSNLLLLHGGLAPDGSETYNDLWQLDTNAWQWKQLNDGPYERHSHNAISINNYLIVAFGLYANATSPTQIIPQL